MSRGRAFLISIFILGVSSAGSKDVEKINKFGVNLFRTLTGDKPGENAVMSPVAAAKGLGLLMPAMSKKSAKQVANMFDVNPEVLMAWEWPSKVDDVNNKFRMETKAFVDAKEELKADNSFDLVQKVNFSKVKKAEKIVNDWVKKATENKITEAVGKNGLPSDPDRAFLYVSAIYFFGEWAKHFEARMTQEMPFYPAVGSPSTALTMRARKWDVLYSLNSYEMNGAAVAVLPYKGGRFEMFLVMPKEGESVDKLLKTMHNTENVVESLRYDLDPGKLDFDVPKFIIESNFDLKNSLDNLGVHDIELSNLFKSRDAVEFSGHIHKAKIEVNENSTEAAAIDVGEASFRSFTFTDQIKFNRPFVFMIVDTKDTDLILFIGRVEQGGNS